MKRISPAPFTIPMTDIVAGFAKNLMQSYRELLTEADIAVITGYLKTLSQDAR